MAIYRIQAEESDFNKYATEGFSCSDHFPWLQKSMDERYFQVVTLSVTGFESNSAADFDEWEVI
jgi:hypothetical protein